MHCEPAAEIAAENERNRTVKNTKLKLRLFIIVILLVSMGMTGVALAEPLFCAVGWFGEFTHIDASIGQVPPTRDDLPSRLQALAWSPSGDLYAGRFGDLYTLDPLTGDTAHFLSINLEIRGMAFSSSGELYVTGGPSGTPDPLQIVDIGTGTYTDQGTLWGDVDECQGLAFSPGGQLYGIVPHGHTEGTYDLFTIDLDDAETHLVGSYATANVNQSIAFTPDGSLYAVGESQFAQLNPADGSIVGPVFGLSGDYRGLAIVPEPGTILLVGLGGLAVLRKRRA
jgi:hypothetical protein